MIVLCGVSDPAAAAALPDCAGMIEVADAPIVRAERNGVLVVSDGRAVKVEGLLLPQGSRDHAPGFLADQAISTLNDFARGHRATLAVHVPKEDRYDRVRAQVFFEDLDEPWLQVAMLRRGLARVNVAADRPECASELYAAEREARDKRFGLWASSAYAIRTPQTVARDVGTFQLVEGMVVTVVTRDGRAYLNFGADWKNDFTVTIAPENMANFRNAYVTPADYQGKFVRVRGFVKQQNGAEIDIATPNAIEIIEAPSMRPAMP
ncbi:MAG: thermonuclease family protein [Proteobacteria bacterium]|nr:thermonuclease family protein [Pseudomonadota bacterium]